MTVGGVVLARDTNGTGGNSGPATKTWVSGADLDRAERDERGRPAAHVHGHAWRRTAAPGFVGIPSEHVDFTLTDSNGAGAALERATSTCDDAGPNTDAQGQCTIVFTSATPGKVTGHASATVSIAGSPVTVSTNGVAPNSGPAVKTFVDANIQITPPPATNPVGANHTLTAHVNVNLGDGAGFVNAPAGTQISFATASGPGSIAGSPCSTVGATGSCTVDAQLRGRGHHDRERIDHAHDGDDPSVIADADDERHRRQLRPGDEAVGGRRGDDEGA